MDNRNENAGRFPCHIWDIADGKEAWDSFHGRLVKDYGDNVTGGDQILHWNHMWDDGGRLLLRCKECGGLVLVQSSEFHSFTDSPDGYYEDWIPVASEEEAHLLNILLDALPMENYSCRHLRRNNGKCFWTGGEEPESADLEELRKEVQEKYPDIDVFL